MIEDAIGALIVALAFGWLIAASYRSLVGNNPIAPKPSIQITREREDERRIEDVKRLYVDGYLSLDELEMKVEFILSGLTSRSPEVEVVRSPYAMRGDTSSAAGMTIGAIPPTSDLYLKSRLITGGCGTIIAEYKPPSTIESR